MKDSNYLIGLLTNISMSGAVSQGSRGGFKGWVLDLLLSFSPFSPLTGSTISSDGPIVCRGEKES